MADIDSALPVRSYQDADERVQVKVVDATTVSQQMVVDADGNAHTEMHGNNPAGTDVVMRLSELGAPNPDGDYDGTDNTKPASIGLIAHDRGASINETSQNKRPTAVEGGSNSVCLDMAMHLSDGSNISESNPVPVFMTEDPGTEVVNFTQSSSVAANSSVDIDYTVTALKTLLISNIWASGSGELKLEVKLETAAASGTYTTKWVGFNSTATPNIDIPASKIGKQVAGAKVRFTITNLDNQAQNLYSTLVGIEK